jgi:hypothetical protein
MTFILSREVLRTPNLAAFHVALLRPVPVGCRSVMVFDLCGIPHHDGDKCRFA